MTRLMVKSRLPVNKNGLITDNVTYEYTSSNLCLFNVERLF